MNVTQLLNKYFESRVRLGIMSILIVNTWVEFNEMKRLLQITDGNLASHASALEKKNYLEVKKEFAGKKPKTSYKVTTLGKKEFTKHINNLGKLLNTK